VTEDEMRERARWLRLEILRVIQGAGLGHYSSTFSCAELFSVLYYRTMRLRPQDPLWEERDRFLLGKGHVAVGLWPILADLGYFPQSWLDDFGKLGAPLTDHPDMRTSRGSTSAPARWGTTSRSVLAWRWRREGLVGTTAPSY